MKRCSTVLTLLLLACGGRDPGGPAVGPAACGPQNCAGCCDIAGHCSAGTTASACGHGGGTCNICPNTMVCSAVLTGGCSLDYQRTWVMGVLSARVPARADGSPPAVYVMQDGHMTAVDAPSTMPIFTVGLRYVLKDLLLSGAQIQLWDRAPGGDRPLMPLSQVTPTETEVSLGVALRSLGAVSLTLNLLPAS